MSEHPGEGAVAAALNRAGLYRVIAAAFAYPTAGGLAHLARLAREMADAPGTSEPLRAPLSSLAAVAAASDAGELAAEHLRLFEGAVRCPPYEGAYGPAQLSGKASQLADLAGFYTAFGLEPAPGRPEVEDHIAVELEFMSALALKEAWAHAEAHAERIEIVRHAAATFLVDHLGRWGPAFAARLEANGSAYPAAVARLLSAWLRADTAALGVSPVPLEGVSATEEAPFACPVAAQEAQG